MLGTEPNNHPTRLPGAENDGNGGTDDSLPFGSLSPFLPPMPGDGNAGAGAGLFAVSPAAPIQRGKAQGRERAARTRRDALEGWGPAQRLLKWISPLSCSDLRWRTADTYDRMTHDWKNDALLCLLLCFSLLHMVKK